jgi:hypothetical protein
MPLTIDVTLPEQVEKTEERPKEDTDKIDDIFDFDKKKKK